MDIVAGSHTGSSAEVDPATPASEEQSATTPALGPVMALETGLGDSCGPSPFCSVVLFPCSSLFVGRQFPCSFLCFSSISIVVV